MRLLLLLTLLTLASCRDRTTGMPRRQVIPRDKFVDVLVDMHKMDALTNYYELFHKMEHGDSIDPYSPILNKYGYSKARFDSTISAYTRHPLKFQKVYDDVILKLTLELDTLNDNEPQFNRETPY
jgi:hypothetical protein